MKRNDKSQQQFCGIGKIFDLILGATTLFLAFYGVFFRGGEVYAASITMTVDSSVETNILPTNSSGTEGSSDTTKSNIKVSTDSQTGYTLSIASSSATSPALTGTNGSIPSIDSAKSTIAEFTSGRWGYKPTKKNGSSWDNLSVTSGSTSYTTGYFLPGPTTIGDVLDTTSTANSTPNEYNLAVATKIGSETKIGSYSSAFVVTAVANEPPEVTFDTAYQMAGKSKVSGTSYYSMQDMTPEICSSVTLLKEGTLIDERDNNKTYSVAKLDDGNCWMTQNLTLGSDTLGEITLTSADSDVSSDFTLSAPTTTSFSSSAYNVVNYRNYTSNSTNYYNWYTATAGTGMQTTAAYTAATSSICPKGWRLPNGSSVSGMAGEWAELFYAAGITGTLATSTSSVSYATGGAAKRAAAPYNIPNNYGYFNTTGTAPTSTSYTYFWTNRTYSSANYAWSTYIGSSSATLNYGSRYKYQGMPMRCVAHKAETQPTITYDANGGTGAPGSTQASSASEFSQSITLSPTKPTRTNYIFDGWATNSSATAPEAMAGGSFSTDKDITLYAVWRLDCRTEPTLATMQNYDKSKLVNIGDTATVCDTRDGTSYTIGKLADGNVWLLDNLALDLTDSTVKTNLTSSTTNASDTSLGYLKNGGGTTSDKYATAGVTNWTSSYSYSAPLINMSNKDKVPSDALSTAGGWKVGGYYNYCAASAGSYCYGDGTSAGTSSGNATEDICPKGWRMPGGSNTIDLTATPPTGEYQNLYNQYNDYTNFRNAFHLPLSGYFNGGSAYGQGSNGGFWSSTRDDYSSMYDLYADTSNIGPSNRNLRSYGFSVRCVSGV